MGLSLFYCLFIQHICTETCSYNILITTHDLIETTCIVWLIVLGFFIFLTMEVLLVVGIIFPILISVLVKKDIPKS